MIEQKIQIPSPSLLDYVLKCGEYPGHPEICNDVPQTLTLVGRLTGHEMDIPIAPGGQNWSTVQLMKHGISLRCQKCLMGTLR